MTNDDSEPTYAEVQAERFRNELPGTIGCICGYSLAAIIACSVFVPSPYGMIAALTLIFLYVGSIVTFGQGSILEMGVMAVILLILCCQCGRIMGGINTTPNRSQNEVQTGG